MQTFLPYPDFSKCAKALDNRRLGKQLVEVTNIANALNDSSNGWYHHPAVAMWRGHFDSLVEYGRACYVEWQRRYTDGERGGKLTHKSGEQILGWYRDLARWIDETRQPPNWLGDERLHSSHRGCLLAKNEDHYSQFWWSESTTPPVDGKWPYWWPEGK